MTTAQTLTDLAVTIATLEAAKDLPDHVDTLCELKRRLVRLADSVSNKVAEQRARARVAQEPQESGFRQASQAAFDNGSHWSKR